MDAENLSLRDVAPVVGMAALWVSVFKQLLYPVLYAYYRTGSDGAFAAQGAYSIALVGGAFLVLVAHERLDALLGKGRWLVAVLGIAGGCGFSLRVSCDFSTDVGIALACLGSVLSALYVPVHLAFWALYTRRSRMGFVRSIALSFLLFLAVYLLLTATGTNTAAVSIACPVISAAMALASPRSTTEVPEPGSSSAESEPAPAESAPASAESKPTSTEPIPLSTDHAPAGIGELPEGFAAAFDLSSREAELAAYAHRNYSARKIAGELFIAESTVYTHLKRIYRKTGVHSKHELIDLIDSWQPTQSSD